MMRPAMSGMPGGTTAVPCRGTCLVSESRRYSAGVALMASALVCLTASSGACFLSRFRDTRVASYGPSWWYTAPAGLVRSSESIMSLGCSRERLCRCGWRSASLRSRLITSSGRCDMSPGWRSRSEAPRRSDVWVAVAMLMLMP